MRRMECTLISSEKGKPMLLIDGFKFSFHKELKGGVKRWMCSCKKSHCKAFVKTNGEENIIIEATLQHNHEKQPEHLLNRQLLSNSVKKVAVEHPTEKPIKLIRKELLQADFKTTTTHDITRARKNAYHARTSILCKLPKNVQEFQEVLEANEVKTSKNEHFILLNDKDNHIVIFATSSNIKFLSGVLDWYVDGTFEYCPKFFLQLFTIHGLKNGLYIPLIFCLLPNKLQHTYKVIFEFLKNILSLEMSNYYPQTITVDFEYAIHSAIAQVFPLAQIRGCRFHLCQAWYRKIQQLGLSSEYKKQNEESSEITKYLTYIFGLPFLRPEDVGDCFAIDFASILPKNDLVIKFSDYLVDNYIDENSKFPPHIWAEHSSSVEHTTNACESFHNQYNSSFYSAHPNLHQFIKVLLDFQLETYRKVRSVDNVRKVQNPKIKLKKEFIDKKIEELYEYKIDRFTFVKALSYRFKSI